MHVLVTRAKEQSGELARLLSQTGATVSYFPVIEIADIDDKDWSDFDKKIEEDYDWLIFASTNSVHKACGRLQSQSKLERLKKFKIAAIGPSTESKLREMGLTVHFQPSTFVAEALIEEFPGAPHLAGLRILWPKTDIGRRLIVDKLTAMGARVDTTVVYRTVLPESSKTEAAATAQALLHGQIDCLTLASAQSVRNFAQLLAGFTAETKITLDEILAKTKIAAIGPITAQTARQILGRVDIEAAEHTMQGLTDSLLASLKFPKEKG